MSESIIMDGTGTGKRAQVDSNNRLRVFAVNEVVSDAKAAQGEGWVFYTDMISITGSTETPLLYMTNNELESSATVSMHFVTGLAGGTPNDPVIFRVYNSATGVSGGVPITVQNRLIGSVRNFSISVSAQDGATPLLATPAADGLMLLHGQAQMMHEDVTPYIVLAGGQSALITVEANGNNTINVSAGITGYIED